VIAWTDLDPLRNGGSPVTDYKIYWNNPIDSFGFLLLASSTKPFYYYSVSNLQSGVVYSFRMVAVNIVGDSGMSVSAGFISSSLPSAPSQPIKL
jgi:hypothetical protein